jgi:hypothetical protein
MKMPTPRTSETRPGSPTPTSLPSTAATQRAEVLLQQMAIEEKAMQLITVTGKTRVIKGEDRAFLSVATVGA